MIIQKLLQFQKLNILVSKVGENPYFNSSYVTLNEVLAKVKKPLNELGILIVQRPQEKGLLTELIDTEDNTKVDGFMPYVEANTAQKLGSNNSYNRRYSLVTMLGLEDVDDDGNVASEQKQYDTTKLNPVQPKPYAKASPFKKATQKQIDFIKKLALERGETILGVDEFDALKASETITRLMAKPNTDNFNVEDHVDYE